MSQYGLLLERLGLAAVLALLVVVLSESGATWRWDQAIYDSQIRLWSRPPPEDIVIIAVDAESIAEVGAWPWARQTHAALLRKLTEAGARAVLLDIIFAEPSNASADQALAEAIRRNGRTLLPVLAEQGRQDAPLAETLPLPILALSAAALGHSHIELDSDGMARSVYLQAGLGRPKWPCFGLATLRLLAPEQWQRLPGLRDLDPSPASPSVWVQDYRVFIPFLGPPGSFRRLSYHQVLRGDVPASFLRGKIVLVGATASGLGDSLPTPVSALSQAMPGVEVHATIIDALRRGLMITPLPHAWQLSISLLLALLPSLLFPHLSPRVSLLAAAALLTLVSLGSLLLLIQFRLWFPPVPALLALALSYPLWSWRRLEYAMRFLNRELQMLSQEHTVLSQNLATDLNNTLGLLEKWLPINGWALLDANGRSVAAAGELPEPPAKANKGTGWLRGQNTLWIWLRRGGRPHHLGLRWAADEPPSEAEQIMLTELARYLDEPREDTLSGTVERVEARIRQVQAATERLRQMSQVVTGSLSEMAGGVLIANAFGQIVLANRSAESCFTAPVGRSLPDVLGELKRPDALPLAPTLADVLLRQLPAQFYAKTRQRDLMVQLAPLTLDARPAGAIVNITDITLLKASERRRLELLGFLSHDLRSPLVSMLALAELARSQLGRAEALEGVLGRMENHTQSILGLANDFLNLIRADSSEEIPLRDIDLELIAQNALDQVWPQADRKGIDLVERFQIEEAKCQGSADLIERALVNLLTNAVKYSPPNTTVTFLLRRRDAYIDCCVQDQGPGIAAADLPYLFDAFRRAGGTQNSEDGHGLGLAFVKIVALRHGGEVAVQSEIGQGSNFRLSLPAL